MGATSLFSKFAKLLDRTTVDLPTLNTPLADALAAKADSSSLSYVALSGSYDDLIDVPSPSPGVSEVADLTDATTYAFPTLNTPLVNALAGKSSTSHNHAGVYDPAGSAAAAQAAAIQRANHTGAQAISTVTGLQTAIDGKSSTSHTHTNAEVNTAIAASPATSATAMGLGTGNTPTFAGLNVTGHVNQTGLGNSTYFGDQAGASDDLTANNNTGVGYQALKSTTTGSYNVASGNNSLRYNSTGSFNVANGVGSLYSNTTGSYNVASGNNSLRSNSSGTNNVANGVSSLYSNTIGGNNVASGVNSLLSNISGANNVANGYQSGRFIADGSANATSSNSVYLGADTKALASGDTNEIVIGYDAAGIGSNTVTLGNSSIVTTALRGNVGIGTTSPAYKLDIFGKVGFHTDGTMRWGNAFDSGKLTWDTGKAVIRGETGKALSLGANGTQDYLYITTTGNVGIGTTSPTGKLNIETASSQTALQAGDLGTLLSTSSASTSNTTHTTSPYLKMVGGIWNGSVNTDRGFMQQIVGVSGANYGYRLNIGSTDIASAMSIVGVSGNVGIGTTSPGDALVVKGGSPGSINLVSFQNNAGNETHRFYTDSTNDGVISTLTNAGVIANLIQTSGGSYFNGGNVGIGTTSPSAKMDILAADLQNQLRVSNTSADSTTKYCALVGRHYTNSEENVTGMLITSNSSITGGAVSIGGGIGSANAANNVVFYTAENNTTLGGSERMRVTPVGNVGIGTTSPAEKLDVVGNIKASGVLKKGVLTVGTLPGSPTAGMSSYVTDSSQTLAAGIGTTLVAAGGGTEYFNPVHYNGTNWIIG
jgi:hypothetical protein